MSDSNVNTGQTAAAQFIPTVAKPLTVESGQERVADYKYKNSLISVPFHVGQSFYKGSTSVNASILSLFKDEFAGKGAIWINKVRVVASSASNKGRFLAAITSEDFQVSSIPEAFSLSSQHYVEFGTPTKGAMFEWDLNWPTSVGRQIKPYSHQYSAPWLLLLTEDVTLMCTIWVDFDHSSNIMAKSGF
jgi:hypothetical protein